MIEVKMLEELLAELKAIHEELAKIGLILEWKDVPRVERVKEVAEDGTITRSLRKIEAPLENLRKDLRMDKKTFDPVKDTQRPE